jgi:hypothetical protein
MTYSLSSNGGIIRDADGAFIPDDPANRDYAEYMAWMAEGNEATPYQPPAPTWGDFQSEARDALEATSHTMERITEAVSLGKTTLAAADVVAFMQYRVALRAIVSEKTGTPGTLPAKPPYPAGT